MKKLSAAILAIAILGGAFAFNYSASHTQKSANDADYPRSVQTL